MADTLDRFLRSAVELYEDVKGQLSAGKKGIDEFLFSTPDIDESANFSLDSLQLTPHGIVFRNRDEQSVVRPYVAGSGQIYELPRSSEKTPITELLRDAVVAGFESTGGFSGKHAKMLERIFTQHISAHNLTRWYLALQTMRTGKFSPYGIDGNDLDMEIDFSRAGTCDITYDFTDTSANIDAAILAMYNAYCDQGGAKANLAIIMGQDWLANYEGDGDVMERMAANTANVVIEQNMLPIEIANTAGLYQAARYRAPGMIAPIWILAFEPDSKFIKHKGATAVDFMPTDEAVMFSIGAKRYRVFRGLDVLDGSNKINRVSGEMVIDTYTEKDPATEFIRSQARFGFIPGDADHTVRSTGTFSES